MQTTYLSMGSNIGDRQYYLHEAIRLLGKHPKIMIEKVSNFYESTPVGGVKQDDFTNLALKVATLLEPLELLSFIHEVELLKPIFELIDKDFKYYASIEKAIAELSVSEQELHVIKEEKTPRNRIEDAVKEILFAVGENPNREGLLETPARVAKMYEEILSSQRLSKFNEYKLFEIDSSKTDSIVLIKDIPFYSMCEHHMLPFFGKAHVAYIPADGKIIGLSKIPRLVDYVSRKLSVQENITHDIGDILTDILNPKGVAVLVEGRHMCVEMRGVKKVNSITKTSYFLGEFKENNEKRMEFLESLL